MNIYSSIIYLFIYLTIYFSYLFSFPANISAKAVSHQYRNQLSWSNFFWPRGSEESPIVKAHSSSDLRYWAGWTMLFRGPVTHIPNGLGCCIIIIGCLEQNWLWKHWNCFKSSTSWFLITWMQSNDEQPT